MQSTEQRKPWLGSFAPSVFALNPSMTVLKHFFSACWVALTSLTLAQINTALGTASLVIGISYQLWKWRKESRIRHLADKD